MTKKHYTKKESDIRKKITTLIKELQLDTALTNCSDTLKECLFTLIRISNEFDNETDLKIIETTLNEMRETFKVFVPFRDIRKVCLFGSARTDPKDADYLMAEKFSNDITKNGYMLITGAGGGIMEAGNKGSEVNMSFGVNIDLPFEQYANEYIRHDPKLVSYKYFFNRKLTFIKESDATVLCPGGFGTHDEGFEVLTLLQNGRCAPRPFILLEKEGGVYWKHWIKFIEKNLLHTNYISEDDSYIHHICTSSEKATEIICEFYKTYHSVRHIEDKTIMRLNSPLKDDFLKTINNEFKNLLVTGKFQQIEPNKLKEDNHNYPDKYKLIFNFNMKNYGLLHHLINTINKNT